MIRADAEAAINERVYLTLGLRAHVSCNPDISPSDFAAFGAALIAEGHGIRSVTLIKDNVISDVYPMEGNEQALGLNLLAHPQQRLAALTAIETGKPWLDGPITLVQGGQAFVNRAPVYVSDLVTDADAGRYWGMVSILIDKDMLISEITRHQPHDLRIAILDSDSLGNRKYIHGDESIASADPIELDVTLPTGRWHIQGVPENGWPTVSPTSLQRRVAGAALAIVAGCLIFALLFANLQYRRARKAALGASLAKSEFLANMSHEIRTPLTAILGFAELIEVSEPEDVEAIKTIKRNGNHLLSILNDVLDLSKMDAGKVKLEQIDFSIPDMLHDIHELMSIRSEAKGIQFEVALDGSTPAFICSDPTRVRQILLNLVGNAIKFTEFGSVRFVARFLPHSCPPYIEFEVTDTGIGMSPDEKARLFNAFSQADNSVSRRFGGTGLGLTICQRLCAMLDGEITLSTKAGTGSTFLARIKYFPAANETFISSINDRQVEQPPQELKRNLPKLAGLRILLVEDGPDNQVLLGRILQNAGAEVTIAENGLIGSDLALKSMTDGEPFDLVLMDMQMPVLDGYSATRRLRASGYSHPVIALTAHSMAEDRAKCIDAGCSGYASKPIQPTKLIEVCLEWAPTPNDLTPSSLAAR